MAPLRPKKEFLEKIPLFQNFSREMLDTIEEAIQMEFFPTEESISTKKDTLYIVSNGSLKITDGKRGKISVYYCLGYLLSTMYILCKKYSWVLNGVWFLSR